MFLLLVPLLPDFTAGRIEAEKELELGVSLVGLVRPQIALDKQRSHLEQLRVEPDRLAASRDGLGPVSGLEQATANARR